MLVLFLILLALDVITTLAVLKQGGREWNPLMRWLMERVGTEVALIVTHVAVGAWAVLGMTDLAITVLCVVFGAVVANNIRVWRANRG